LGATKRGKNKATLLNPVTSNETIIDLNFVLESVDIVKVSIASSYENRTNNNHFANNGSPEVTILFIHWMNHAKIVKDSFKS